LINYLINEKIHLIGGQMDGILKEALQNGKAHHNMKKVWMLRWLIGFWLLFFFLLLIIGIAFLTLITNSGIIVILLYYLILPLLFAFVFAYVWANLYWKNYTFEVGPEKITVTRGVIGKRIMNIPYERVQNVNIYRGVLERIFGLFSVEIETAGGFGIGGTGGYGTRMTAEGDIQGITNPQPIADYIIAKSKGKETLQDTLADKDLNKNEMIRLLEERLLRGEISEKNYEDLKRKYEKS
jgi:uncharacterized membrane protein YdbT with pleckstrin-like domain